MPAPCFQFYPEEFVGSGTVGTADANEVCAYTMLLCLDWTEDGFLFDEKRLARFCKLSVPQFRKAWAHLADKFPARDGRHYNPRLEKERAKQAAWREKSKKGAEKANEKRWGPHQGGGQGGDEMANASESPEGRIPLPLPLPLPSPQPELPTTPLLPEQPAKAAGGGWPTAVAEEWVRRVGVIREGRVGKDLQPFVRLYPDPAAAQAAVVKAVGVYADLCARRSQTPAWPDFVRGVQGYVPATLLPPERAA